MMDLPTPIESVFIQQRHFFIKRDDLIDPLFSGNKYRKLHMLIETPAEQYQRIISFGGSQSNAMISIAALCKQKGWQFDYTTKTLPQRLKAHPTGNLKLALNMGMRLHEVSPESYPDAVQALGYHIGEDTLLLPQGGADPLAQGGLTVLAREIEQWAQQQSIAELCVVTPSGTGTTAYYLARALPEASILTTPVVGGRAYLLAQIERLGSVPANLCILEGNKRYHFARPHPDLLATWKMLKKNGVVVDLIYGALMWHRLLQHVEQLSGTTLYVHSGGLAGNETMLDRYRHQNLLGISEM